jgi:outer membrane autotransporter protein
MEREMKFDIKANKRLLTQALLASTILMSPVAGAVVNVGAGPLAVGVNPADFIDFNLNPGVAVTVNVAAGINITGVVPPGPLAGYGQTAFSNTGGNTLNIINFAGASTVTGNITAPAAGFEVPTNVINLNGAGTIVTFLNNVDANTINFGADGTATLGANGALATNNIITATNNTGTIKFTGAGGILVAANGIGTNTNKLKAMITPGGGALVDIDTPSLYVTNITVTAGDTIDFQPMLVPGVINAAIDGSAGGVGTVGFNGNYTLNGVIGGINGLLALNLSGPGTFGMTQNIKATNVVVSFGENLMPSGPLTITGNLNISDAASQVTVKNNAGVLSNLTVTGTFGLTGALNYDMNTLPVIAVAAPGTTGIVATGAVTLAAGSVVDILNPYLYVPVGTTQSLVALSSAGAITDNGVVVTSPNIFSGNFTKAIAGAPSTLTVGFTRLAAASFAQQQNLVGGASQLDNLLALGPNATTGSLALLLGQMNQFTDVGMFQYDLSTLVPLVDRGIIDSMFDLADANNSIIERNIAERRDRYNKHRHAASYNTGYAAGDIDEKGRAVWVNVFGQSSKQKSRRNITGYDADSYGIALGGDVMVTDEALIGLSFSWASTDVDHDLNNAETDIDSYRLTAYGSYDFNCPVYMNWLASAGYNDYTTQRYVTFGNVNLSPRSHYHAWQYEVKGELGYIMGSNEYHVIPNVSLDFARLDFHDFMEKKADTANQRISYDEASMFKAGVGVKFVYDYGYDKTHLQPEAHANAYYDFMNDRMEASSSFVGGGIGFRTTGYRPSRDSYNLGLSLTAFAENGFVFTASYDFNFRERYTANNGFLRMRYEW